ncbi:hypothetical protein [Microbacterium rhizophilus]|uniref:hypothetical protein n=1 Tax=Microbacterium rhizophilus TaxID=3138934 RepID=UPI0031EA06A5
MATLRWAFALAAASCLVHVLLTERVNGVALLAALLAVLAVRPQLVADLWSAAADLFHADAWVEDDPAPEPSRLDQLDDVDRR